MSKVIKLVSAVILTLALSTGAMASEYIRVCRPCSRNFIPVAERVIAELNLEDQVQIKPSSCLGQCGHGVIEFRDRVYSGMDEDMLREMLKDAFDLK